MAVAAVLALPPCPDCAGGGEVNGLPCRGCGGTTRAGGPPRRRWWRPSLSPALGPLAGAAGWLAGRVLGSLPAVPGIAGAVMVSAGAGEVTGHVFGHGLAPWAGLAVGGVFALLLDRRI